MIIEAVEGAKVASEVEIEDDAQEDIDCSCVDVEDAFEAENDDGASGDVEGAFEDVGVSCEDIEGAFEDFFFDIFGILKGRNFFEAVSGASVAAEANSLEGDRDRSLSGGDLVSSDILRRLT